MAPAPSPFTELTALHHRLQRLGHPEGDAARLVRRMGDAARVVEGVLGTAGSLEIAAEDARRAGLFHEVQERLRAAQRELVAAATALVDDEEAWQNPRPPR